MFFWSFFKGCKKSDHDLNWDYQHSTVLEKTIFYDSNVKKNFALNWMMCTIIFQLHATISASFQLNIWRFFEQMKLAFVMYMITFLVKIILNKPLEQLFTVNFKSIAEFPQIKPQLFRADCWQDLNTTVCSPYKWLNEPSFWHAKL